MRVCWPLQVLFLTAQVLFLTAASCGAMAAPATSEGAKAIEQGYVEYFSRAVIDRGVVTVTPSGDDYLVAWDLQKALELAGMDHAALRIEPFAYTMTPRDDGAWTVKADRLPSLVFEMDSDKDRVNGAVSVGGFRLETLFGGAQQELMRSLAAADAVTARVQSVQPGERADVKLAESDIAIETRARPSEDGAGVDVAIAQSVGRLVETILMTGSDPSDAPTNFDYEAGGIRGGVRISNLRAREIADLWKYLVAHMQDPGAPPDLKRRVRAALPLWKDIRGEAVVHDLALRGPLVEATLKTFGEKLGLSGFTEEGSAEIGIKVEALAFKAGLLPSWADQLSPLSFDVDVRVVDKGLDKAAELALNDSDFDATGDFTSETLAQITVTLLAGRPRIELAPGRLTLPIIDLAYEGEAVFEGGSPTARLAVSVDGLDKTVAFLEQAAKDDSDARSIALGVAFAKGLAISAPDGRLGWKIELSPSGDITVNGTPLPTGK